jgi:hypothetical protein
MIGMPVEIADFSHGNVMSWVNLEQFELYLRSLIGHLVKKRDSPLSGLPHSHIQPTPAPVPYSRFPSHAVLPAVDVCARCWASALGDDPEPTAAHAYGRREEEGGKAGSEREPKREQGPQSRGSRGQEPWIERDSLRGKG